MTPALQRPHVLIVSDDSDLASFFGEGLVYAGFWTSSIASALQALEVFRMRSFDIMIIDTAIGGIGAVELVRRLRDRSGKGSVEARTDVPIVLIAESPDEFAPEIAAGLGVEGMLYAPLELPTLGEQLNKEVLRWRAKHPGRPWADEAALARN